MTAIEIAAKTGVTWRQLSHWVRRGWIKTANVRAMGRPLSFDGVELEVVKIMAELVKFGFEPEIAHKYARQQAENSHPRLVLEIPHVGRLIIWNSTLEK